MPSSVNVEEWADNLRNFVADCYDGDLQEGADPYSGLLAAAEDLLAAMDAAHAEQLAAQHDDTAVGDHGNVGDLGADVKPPV